MRGSCKWDRMKLSWVVRSFPKAASSGFSPTSRVDLQQLAIANINTKSTMLQRIQRPLLRRVVQTYTRQYPRRTLVPPPKPGSGPLLERRSDRELPSLVSIQRNPILRGLPLFAVILIASAAAIFNYQKSSSSVVQSSLYALRTSDRARELLGEEIYFGSRIPWIWGTIDQLHGKIDIRFSVAGTKDRGLMRFKSERTGRRAYVSAASPNFQIGWHLWPCTDMLSSLRLRNGPWS